MSKVTIGIIGAGRIGKLHATNLIRNRQVDLKWISDIYVDRMKNWANEIGITRVTSDYSDIINDPQVDAIFVCSSTNTHTDIIIEAAKAGKHIFCEKPISFDLTQTIKAVETAEQEGVKLQVGFNRRFDRNFKRVRDLVREGKIGEPHVLKITSRDPEPPHKDYIKVSGGMFMDMVIHDFDMARYLSGSDAEQVYVQAGVFVSPDFAELGDVDTAVTVLTFKNGTIGVIDNSRKAVYGYDQRAEVFGSGGCLTIKNEFPSSTELATADGVHSEKPHYFFLERYNEAFIEETKRFIDSIQNGSDTLVTGNDALQAELMAHAAKKSLEEKRPVRIEEIIKKMVLEGHK